MRLLNKITFWFIGIILLVTPITMYISFSNIRSRIDKAEVKRMTDVNEQTAQQLAAGRQLEAYTLGRPIEITVFDGPMPAKKVNVAENCTYNKELKQNECKLTVSSYYDIGGKHYKISSYNYITRSKEILSGMLNAVIWKMILIILAVSLTARLLSRHIFSPFRKTMKAIHNFNLKQKEKITLPDTSIKEFRELNVFLKKMTDKAMEDYASVKEFSENASHELQTPLAVIHSKLELLTETNINEGQAVLISDMQNAIEKLSRINRSLILLTKVENLEYETSAQIKFCTVAKEMLAIYADRISLKELAIVSELDKDVSLKIHPALADMMLNNLLGNAIRHNIKGGSIKMQLTQQELVISNTGLPPQIPTEELFQRFKKSDQSAESIGLGLAIVKQICEVNGLEVTYRYCDGWHTVRVCFGNDKANAHDAALRKTGKEAIPV